MISLLKIFSPNLTLHRALTYLVLAVGFFLSFDSTAQNSAPNSPSTVGSANTNGASPATAMTASPADPQNVNNKYPKVRFVTSQGEILVELYPDKAPKTVANFLQYVKEKHYDGTIFHRVINDFMIQGGGFDAKFNERKTHPPIAHEGRQALSLGGPRNTVGTLAMARTGDPNSATAQFFINVKDNASLDPVIIPPGDPVPAIEFNGRIYRNIARSQLEQASQLYGYTVFGKVIAGMDTVEKIKLMPTGPGGPFPTDAPKTTVLIQSASITQ